MFVYRIAKSQFAEDLSGTGAKLYGGRWNPRGLEVLYTSEHKSLAALELLVHASQVHLVANDYKLVTLEILKPNDILEIKLDELPKGWFESPVLPSVQAYGKEILSSGLLGFSVPSVLIKQERNIVLNPKCKSFSKSVKIVEIVDFYLDHRFV